jgi:hypothetical protein
MKGEVKAKFKTYPPLVRKRLLELRALILNMADLTQGVGPIEETLKWGEPSYLTSVSKSGTTLRLDWKKKNPQYLALYVNCRTNLIDSYSALFPGVFKFEGNRAILFDIDEELPTDELKICIELALTYHLN